MLKSYSLLVISKKISRKNVVEWWAPNDWPRNYSMSLQPANSESYVWSQNVTVKFVIKILSLSIVLY